MIIGIDDGRPQVAPTRIRNRLLGYDCNQQGAYFITVCTQNRAELFGRIVVGANCVRPITELSDMGQVVKHEIEMLSAIYSTVHVCEFVIMPNHVHMIIVIETESPTAPTLSRIVKQWKGAITKRLGVSPWQKSFHDHVIRNHDDYLRIAQYIEDNPAHWQLDSLHPLHNPT